jgi:hypothetical protein
VEQFVANFDESVAESLVADLVLVLLHKPLEPLAKS